MTISALVEVLSAFHLSYYVESRFEERGGLMLVGPPATLKTAVTEVMDNYPNVVMLSDLTVKQGTRLREDIACHRVITLVFSDFAKLYQRAATGAANVEGFIRALTAEGYRRANWEDSRMTVIPARSLVIGSMTTRFYTMHYSDWLDDGFARRFVWSHFILQHPDAILDAIEQNIKLEFSTDGFNPKIPTDKKGIPFLVSPAEAKLIRDLLRHQPGREIGLSVMQKVLCALKWKFPKDQEKPMAIIREFAESLGKEGARLSL